MIPTYTDEGIDKDRAKSIDLYGDQKFFDASVLYARGSIIQSKPFGTSAEIVLKHASICLFVIYQAK